MKKATTLKVAATTLALMLLVACGNAANPTDTGVDTNNTPEVENMDDAMDAMEDAMDDVDMDDVDMDAVNNAMDEAAEAMDDVDMDAVNNAMDDAAEAMDDAAEAMDDEEEATE